jgi:outer membrane cobalamin receptor
MMRYVLTVIIFLSPFALLNASTGGIIKGKVVDKGTGEPLAGVYVIYGKNLGTITDDNGTYQIENISGKLSLTFQLLGYELVTKEVTVGNEETVELDISLETQMSEINQIVITANKTEQKIGELTVSMDVIKQAFITNNHITDPQEIINKTSGIEVIDGQASVRGGSGFSYGAGSRVLALVDGLPMISADAGNIKWQFLPLENLSKIEIIKGASSVLYGSSALNGVINFITADASNIPVTNFYVELGAFGKPKNRERIWWESPRIFSSASFSHMQKYGNTDVSFSAALLDDEGYRWLNGDKLGRITLKLKHFNSHIKGLTYGMSANTGYTVKRDFVLWQNAGAGALKQQENATIQLHGTYLAFDPFITFKKTNRYSHDLRMRFQSTLNRFPESVKTNSDAYSLYSEYQYWKKVTGYLDITAGLTETFSMIRSNMYEDHNGFSLGGYAQLEIRPFEKVKGTAGVRVEQNSVDGIFDRIVPVFRAGLNWQVADYSYLRLSFGQGYRYPSIAEKFASTTLGSVAIFPNPDILPESGWSTEAGLKQGVVIGNLKGQLDFSLFMSQNTNMIEYYLSVYNDPSTGLTSTGFKATNIEQSRVYGGEMEVILNGSIGNINTTFTGGYTYIYPVEFNKSTNQNTNEYLKYRRKHSGKASLYLSWKKVESELNVYAMSKILRIDSFFLTEETGEAILPGFPEYWKTHDTGYFLSDLSTGYKISSKLTLSLAVKNLTNTEYMARPGDIRPQRNYSLRLSGKL